MKFKNVSGQAQVLYDVHQIPPDGRRIVAVDEVIEVGSEGEITHLQGLCQPRSVIRRHTDLHSVAITEASEPGPFAEVR